MIHMAEITAQLDRGEEAQAQAALELLLTLGPRNTEALRLRAALYEREGRFESADEIWNRILEFDGEEPYARAHMTEKHYDMQERQFFMESIPGGRRFLTFPKGLLYGSLFGMVGCLIFLLMSRLGTVYFFFSLPAVMGGTFGLFVLGPWILVLYQYLGALQSVTVQTTGIELQTRLRTLFFPWEQFSHVYLLHPEKPQCQGLRLVLVAKEGSMGIDLNVDPETSNLRALKTFLSEVKRFYPEVQYGTEGMVPFLGKWLRF
jgi:tetratricopeptide (TPR) repeat protein